MSCHDNGREYHILGYNIDPDNAQLKIHIENFRIAREKRAKIITQKLNRTGLLINFDSVAEKAGHAPIARPHIASVMIDNGYISSMKEAFSQYIGEGRPAYQEKEFFSLQSCIELINNSGGVAVLAHPAVVIEQSVIYRMIRFGLDGIEVIHPSHSDEIKRYYHKLASQFWLLETGGSDYHGSRDYDEETFGKSAVPAKIIDSIKLRKVSH